MYLHRVESTFGRPIPKPRLETTEEDELFDEVVPIQDQIESLRTKITLKEKYNRVLTEDFEESRQGASSILLDLHRETRELRFRLMTALKSEQTCVQKALRTQRIFQLAMTGRNVMIAIPWLDDKLFDMNKIWNDSLDVLKSKRVRLEEAERMVLMIEKWPRPGTLPWELAALNEFEKLNNVIESVKIRGETSMILHSKYYNIKFILREEQGKYLPTIRALENQLRLLKQELASLQQMLDEALYFREDAYKSLTITEKEASENRKQRRKQMAKMKKAVDKVLHENDSRNLLASTIKSFDYSKFEDLVETSVLLEELKVKKEVVSHYRDRARRLVEVMRVQDLTQIPERSKNVVALGVRLLDELWAKEDFRDLLVRQRDQLTLILCRFQYSGQKRALEFKRRHNNYNDAVRLVQSDLAEAGKRLQRYGDIFVDIRLTILTILGRLDPKKRHGTIFSGDLKSQMKKVITRLRKLVGSLERSTERFAGMTPERNYDQMVKPPVVQPRHVRLGSPVVTDESEEEDMPDLKVPNRQDIKNKSIRVIHQSILRRGLH